jgi:cytochrome b subunit of formate dehydrogenase
MKPVTGAERTYVRRFSQAQRILHGVMMLSFLGLAATGLPLLFSEAAWASRLARVFGGMAAAGSIHRVFATTMIGVFAVHVGSLLRRLLVDRDYSILWGPTSLVPQPRDAFEMLRHMLWFVGRGPRPAFDRYTYWEKFDYWAVFWGMAIIGGSGIMLWFPVLFARVVPGWLFNIALLVHGEEALLAVGFIFTIHFFNSHLRPEKFPMDMVIFTGRVPMEELRHERPGEYARLRETGELDRLVVPAPRHGVWMTGRIVGTVAVTVGVMLLVLILYAVGLS